MATQPGVAKTPIAAAVEAIPAPAAAPEVQAEEPRREQPRNEGGEFVKIDHTKNPRYAVLKEIAAESNARADAEAQETIPPGDDDVARAAEEAPVDPVAPDTEEEAPAEAPATAPSAPAAPAAAQPSANNVDPNGDYEVRVDGVLMKVKGSKIIDAGFRTFQKETAADYRLQLASQMLDEARKVAQGQLPAQGAAPQQPSAESLTPEQLAEMVQYGTKEQAAAAFSVMMRANTAQPQDMQRVLAEALPRAVDQRLTLIQAANFAKNEYGDLLADPYLSKVFFSEEEALRRNNDQRPHAVIYKEIGDGIRKHFNRPKAAPTPVEKTMAQRVEAKAKMPLAPKLAASRMDGGATPTKAPTAQEIIDQVRLKRGQTSLNR